MAPQDGRPDLSVAAISAAEGDGTLRFTVSLSRASGEPVSVAYRTENGTAAAGVDYEPARGRLTFAAESTEAQRIEVTVIDDQVDEAAETLTVRLNDPQGRRCGWLRRRGRSSMTTSARCWWSLVS